MPHNSVRSNESWVILGNKGPLTLRLASALCPHRGPGSLGPWAQASHVRSIIWPILMVTPPAVGHFSCSRLLLLHQVTLFAAGISSCSRSLLLQQVTLPAAVHSSCSRSLLLQQVTSPSAGHSSCSRSLPCSRSLYLKQVTLLAATFLNWRRFQVTWPFPKASTKRSVCRGRCQSGRVMCLVMCGLISRFTNTSAEMQQISPTACDHPNHPKF